MLNIHLVDIEDEFNLLLVFQKYEPNRDQLFNIMIHKMLNFAIIDYKTHILLFIEFRRQYMS